MNMLLVRIYAKKIKNEYRWNIDMFFWFLNNKSPKIKNVIGIRICTRFKWVSIVIWFLNKFILIMLNIAVRTKLDEIILFSIFFIPKYNIIGKKIKKLPSLFFELSKDIESKISKDIIYIGKGNYFEIWDFKMGIKNKERARKSIIK